MNFPPSNSLFLTFIKAHFLLLWGKKSNSDHLLKPREMSEERINKRSFHPAIKQLIALLNNLYKPGENLLEKYSQRIYFNQSMCDSKKEERSTWGEGVPEKAQSAFPKGVEGKCVLRIDSVVWYF